MILWRRKKNASIQTIARVRVNSHHLALPCPIGQYALFIHLHTKLVIIGFIWTKLRLWTSWTLFFAHEKSRQEKKNNDKILLEQWLSLKYRKISLKFLFLQELVFKGKRHLVIFGLDLSTWPEFGYSKWTYCLFKVSKFSKVRKIVSISIIVIGFYGFLHCWIINNEVFTKKIGLSLFPAFVLVTFCFSHLCQNTNFAHFPTFDHFGVHSCSQSASLSYDTGEKMSRMPFSLNKL